MSQVICEAQVQSCKVSVQTTLLDGAKPACKRLSLYNSFSVRALATLFASLANLKNHSAHHTDPDRTSAAQWVLDQSAIDERNAHLRSVYQYRQRLVSRYSGVQRSLVSRPPAIAVRSQSNPTWLHHAKSMPLLRNGKTCRLVHLRFCALSSNVQESL